MLVDMRTTDVQYAHRLFHEPYIRQTEFFWRNEVFFGSVRGKSSVCEKVDARMLFLKDYGHTFVPKNLGKFSEFWDIWVEVLVIFGLGLGLLGLVWVGISWDLGVPTQPKTTFFFRYKCMHMVS
jgi:hypothetical protein